MRNNVSLKFPVYLLFSLLFVQLSCSKEEVAGTANNPNNGGSKTVKEDVFEIRLSIKSSSKERIDSTLLKTYTYEYKGGNLTSKNSRKILEDIVLDPISKTEVLGFSTCDIPIAEVFIEVEKKDGESIDISNIADKFQCNFGQLSDKFSLSQCSDGECTEVTSIEDISFLKDPNNSSLASCSFSVMNNCSEDVFAEQIESFSCSISEPAGKELIKIKQEVNLTSRPLELKAMVTKFASCLEPSEENSEISSIVFEEYKNHPSGNVIPALINDLMLDRKHKVFCDPRPQKLARVFLEVSDEYIRDYASSRIIWHYINQDAIHHNLANYVSSWDPTTVGFPYGEANFEFLGNNQDDVFEDNYIVFRILILREGLDPSLDFKNGQQSVYVGTFDPKRVGAVYYVQITMNVDVVS